MKTELYLGLDVDKEWMVIALADWGRNGAVQDLGAIRNDLHALEKLLALSWRPRTSKRERSQTPTNNHPTTHDTPCHKTYLSKLTP
jgi:hypothetical protein